MDTTIIEDDMLSDDDDETNDFLRKPPPPPPRCRLRLCKWFMVSLAIGLVSAMLVQIWSDYGEYIQTQAFPPRIYSMSYQCNSVNDIRKGYKSPPCVWGNPRVLTCEITKPSNYIVNVDADVSDMVWGDLLNITFVSDRVRCIHLTIWSI